MMDWASATVKMRSWTFSIRNVSVFETGFSLAGVTSICSDLVFAFCT